MIQRLREKTKLLWGIGLAPEMSAIFKMVLHTMQMSDYMYIAITTGVNESVAKRRSG